MSDNKPDNKPEKRSKATREERRKMFARRELVEYRYGRSKSRD